MRDGMELSRRALLGLLAGGAAAAGLGAAKPARAAKVATSARIVILGAGAAGAAMANKLTERLDGATITLIDGRPEHWYQPGFTLIAAGLKPAAYSVSTTGEWLPREATLIAEYAAEIDPEAKRVTTAGGTAVDYDFLVVATGLKLDWDAIEGFSLDMVGQNGIGAVYAGPDHAAKTWAEMDRFTSDRRAGRVSAPRDRDEMRGRAAQVHLPHRRLRPPEGQRATGSRSPMPRTTSRSSACRSWPRRCGCSTRSAGSAWSTTMC
jgi:choline dehydrogenase-like flavoprotein